MVKAESLNHEQVLKASILYYEQNMTQEQVAKIIGISRPKVSVLLQEARKSHLVEFFVKDVNKHIIELELALKQRYQLNDVKVVSTRYQRSAESVRNQVGMLSAQYLSSVLDKVKSVGIGWGQAVSCFVAETNYLRANNLTIVPLVGGMGALSLDVHANHLVSELAVKLNSQYSTFYAPVIAESAEVANELKKSKLVDSALSAAKAVDVAFIGVGNDVRTSTWRKLDYISETETQELEAAGALGDVVSDFFDENCQTVKTDFSNRLIGITIDDLIKIPDVVAMATGIKKAANIKILLEHGVVNTLFIDQEIAEAII
jgi:DNA-binding transcriptional regulator LsrR (DeoR family)